jgi:hypothetical protein
MRVSLLIAFVSALTLAALSAAPLAQTSPPPPPPAYLVVVHPSSGASSLERRFLEDVFLKKIRSWPGGEPIRPVDLAPSSLVRRRFSEEVLRRPVAAVRAYWQQRIFSGRDLPPPEMDNDADVIKYVLKHPGAVAYVSGTTPLAGVKVVSVR